MGLSSYNFEQKQDENDEQDEADAATAVITESWTQTIAAKTEHQNQDNQNNEHCTSPWRRRFAR